ncbi:MAG: hypothetical protein NVS4B11_29000 [Ktedonobacteraceae bacterium]
MSLENPTPNERTHHEVTPVTPTPRPRPEAVITPRQERALRYLERKNARKYHPAQPTALVSLAQADTLTPIPVLSAESNNSVQGSMGVATISTIEPLKDTPISAPVEHTPVPSASTATALEVYQFKRRKKLLLRHLSRKNLRLTRNDERRKTQRLWLTLGSTLMSLLIVLLSLSGAGAYTAFRFYNDTQYKYIPRVTTLHDLLPHDNLKMYDSKGVFIGELTDQGLHTAVTLDNVSPSLINATVATEDKNFWTNPGVDILRIIRAALDNVQSGHVVEGGSTITQQLIKNLVVGNEASIVRKLQEIALTPQVNSRYSKRDILQMYLNSIFYGEQAYGIDAAANIYFDIEDTQGGPPASSKLDLAQAAMLAGLPNSPDAYDPLRHPKAAINRCQTVLDLMLNQQYITKVQAIDAIKEARSPGFFKRPTSLTNRAPHFFNFVLTQLQQIYHLKREQLSRSDMVVYTTLDIALQDKIQKIAQKQVADLFTTGHNVSNAAEVLIDYHTGAIISLLGSIDYNNTSIDGQFDVATQSYRQPGSSFKPYVYVTAFEQGASPAQAVADRPLTILLPDSIPPTFTPENYDMRYHGHMTLRCALQNSLNIPAVRVLQHVGIDNAMKTAHDMGITSYEGTPGYSLVLGGLGVKLIDHTSAMGTFANGGVHMPYYAIQKVVFASTNQTYGHANTNGTRVLSPQLAYMMTNVLSDNESRKPEFYDCNVLQLFSNSRNECWAGNRGTVRPAAAKTGTTTDFRDNWTMGYTTDYVMGVWVGNDNNTPMYNILGVDGAAPIWHDSMLVAEQGHPIRDFTYPGGLQQATVTYPDGVRSTDWFLPGTVPSFAPSVQPTVTPIGTDTSTIVQVASPKPVAPTGYAYCPNNFSLVSPTPSDSASNPGWW